MNKMKEVAELLGVELEEEFEIEHDDNKYKLTVDGLYCDYDNYENIKDITLSSLLRDLLKIKKQWKPKVGELYYSIDFNKQCMFEYYSWKNDIYDNRQLERGLVFKTQDEAVVCAKKMLEAVKEQ